MVDSRIECSVLFKPGGQQVDVEPETRILAAARRANAPIRFMCSSLRCGTCAIRVDVTAGSLSGMADDELRMLRRLKLSTDGSIRMACRARVLSGTVKVDLNFQESYDPSDNDDFSTDA